MARDQVERSGESNEGSTGRRELLTMALAGMATAAAGARASGIPPGPGPGVPPGGPAGGLAARDKPGGPLPDKLLRALVERCCYGFTPEEFALAQFLGPQAYVERHLNPDAISDAVLDGMLAPLQSLPMTAPQLLIAYINPGNGPVPVQQLKHAAVLRAVFSRRQLFERVVEFWTDHFSVRQTKGTVRYLKVVDDREVVRKHALGSFPELLSASAHSACMLRFLDNDTNMLAGPNENFARELMELHTLGVDGGYTETDVKEAARCLTGWRFVPWGSAPWGTFQFFPEEHDFGEKVVLGHVFAAGGGQSDGETLLQILAEHPSTAKYVAGKLARRLLGYDPPQALVNEVAAAYTATGGDVRSMIRIVLAPQWLLAAKPVQQPKLRRPHHFVAGLLRSLGAQIVPPDTYMKPTPIVTELLNMGQIPFEWFEPDGYPDNEAAWASGLQPRWSFASRLLAGEMVGATVDPTLVLQRLAATGQTELAAAVDVLLTGGAFSDLDRQVLADYAALFPVLDWTVISEVLALGASSRSYQYF